MVRFWNKKNAKDEATDPKKDEEGVENVDEKAKPDEKQIKSESYSTNNDADESDTSFLKNLWLRRASNKASDEMKTPPAEPTDSSEEATRSNTSTTNNKLDDKSTTKSNSSEPKSSLLSGLWSRKSTSEEPNSDNKVADIKANIPVEEKKSSLSKITERLNIDAKLTSVAKQYSSKLNKSDDRPSIFEESLEMLTAALLIYTFADLRQMAREGAIQSSNLLKHPIQISQVVEVIQSHTGALEERAKKFEDMANRLTALKDIHDQQQKSSTLVGSVLRGSKSYQESYLATFHDEKSTQGMVYGIAVNHLRKRVTVIFRGSVTQQDFITDAKCIQKKLDNPVHALAPDTTTDTIRIHTGFYQYLFQKDDEGKVRLKHILEDVKALLKENPGYRCYCTGHSLGGALATLCGFYAAQEDDILRNGSVVVISIASPRVGNKKFRWAFQALEKLQRVTNVQAYKVKFLHTINTIARKPCFWLSFKVLFKIFFLNKKLEE